MLTGCWDMGRGEKIGAITRLQKTGIICQTWEGISQRGGINNGSGVVGGEFHFTIENDELAKKVQQAMENQQEVKLSYQKEGFTFCRSDSDNIFLTGIEAVNGVSTPPEQSKEISITPKAASQNDVTIEILKQNQQMLANQEALLEELKKMKSQ